VPQSNIFHMLCERGENYMKELFCHLETASHALAEPRKRGCEGASAVLASLISTVTYCHEKLVVRPFCTNFSIEPAHFATNRQNSSVSFEHFLANRGSQMHVPLCQIHVYFPYISLGIDKFYRASTWACA
jgi:hypothetical protein